ncbi:hypothetical protein H257_09607 [Aphanomyces astaci]|uniref:Uncharacterized protein n=1 Tax=Aphanomyces astaci TaxID=112090 RepID=W4G8N3_APHAT|nr:hypothetical protein H257_09607 [Aphanomyces astaci]ETV76042.1 hypothetical protein H257_09607 [Aphanomyces astaci]|eukprot:XP_009834167.1 hypothetical protein H257_09607 [Aphanomyces astaci]
MELKPPFHSVAADSGVQRRKTTSQYTVEAAEESVVQRRQRTSSTTHLRPPSSLRCTAFHPPSANARSRAVEYSEDGERRSDVVGTHGTSQYSASVHHSGPPPSSSHSTVHCGDHTTFIIDAVLHSTTAVAQIAAGQCSDDQYALLQHFSVHHHRLLHRPPPLQSAGERRWSAAKLVLYVRQDAAPSYGQNGQLDGSGLWSTATVEDIAPSTITAPLPATAATPQCPPSWTHSTAHHRRPK